MFSATYRVTINPGEGTATVRVNLEDKDAKEFRMPAWAPGDYRIVNFGKRLSNITLQFKGKPVEPAPTDDPNKFIATEVFDEIQYTVRQSRGIFAEDLRIRNGEVVWNGPAVLGYFVGHQNEKHTLSVKKLSEITEVEIALDPIDAENGWAGFIAQNYDELIDAPLVMGDSIELRTFTLFGIEHRIVAFGKNQGVDLLSYEKMVRPIVEATKHLFGTLPYKNYRFLIDFDGGNSGLEHANSSCISISRRLNAIDSAPLFVHEYFHAWNAKRIRPNTLNPFDYSKPAITGALWWFEGVTDYYADLICYRAGIFSRSQFMDKFSALLRSQTFPSLFRVSANESSRRVWEANNSFGFGGVDYYSKGKAIGFGLDIAIRKESKGTRSLDDVMIALNKECNGGKSGFSESRIQELCVLFGGPVLNDIFDASVLQPGSLPLERILTNSGFIWSQGYLREYESATPSEKAIANSYPDSLR